MNILDNTQSVSDELSFFESKVRGDMSSHQSKYPNIELKRIFDAKNFKKSNDQITQMTMTRAGSLRSHVKTTVPRKRLTKLQRGARDAAHVDDEEASES